MPYEYDDPHRTLELISSLVSVGLTDSAFSKLHHFKKSEKIASHRRYCEELADEGARFRTNSNRLVQRRLELVLRLLESTPIAARTGPMFELLAQVSRLEFPDDTRPLSEQSAESDARRQDSAA